MKMLPNTASVCLALLALCLGLAAAPALADKRVALVIGNSAYEHAASLPNPANDAEALRDVLGELGFEVTFGEDLGQQSFAATLGAFAAELEEADAAVFYYAGHGVQIDGDNYLVSVDAKLDNSFAIYGETIPLQEIINLMEQSSPVNLVFLDACRDNPFLDTLQAAMSKSRSASVSRGLAPVRSSRSDTMIMYATEADNVAADGAGAHSPFAAALIAHLSTPQAEVSQVVKRVIKDVRETTAFRQSPELLSAMSVEFYFNPDGGGAETGNLSADSDVSAAYKIAEQANSVPAWRAFLDAYPDGFHSGLARDALITLEGQQASFDAFADFQSVEDSLDLGQEEREFIQTVLNGMGYAVGTVDGKFGAKTRLQISAFQRETGLMPTGYVDAVARAQFASEATQKTAGRSFDAAAYLTGPEAEKALALTASEIRLLQAGLVSYGYDPRTSAGVLDPDTRGALRQYQFKRGLETDGYVTAAIAEDLLARGRENIGRLGTYIELNKLGANTDPRLKATVRAYDGPMNYGYFDNTLYVVVGDGSPHWDEAREKAEALGGHLAVISSAAERAFIEDLFKYDPRFFQHGGCCFQGPFLGYYQEASAKRPADGWVSVTGEPFRFIDWLKGYPHQLLDGNFGYLAYGGREGAIETFRRSPTVVDEIRFQSLGVAHVIEFPPLEGGDV